MIESVSHGLLGLGEDGPDLLDAAVGMPVAHIHHRVIGEQSHYLVESAPVTVGVVRGD